MYWSLTFVATFLLYGVLSPYISALIRGYGYSPAMVGILLAACEAAAIASPFVFGRFADRLGRYRPIILISLTLSLVCGVVLFFSRDTILCAIVVPLLAFGYRAVQPLTDAVSTINLGKDGNYGKYRTVGSLAFFSLVLFLQWTPVLRPNKPSNIALWVCVTAIISIILIFIIPRSYFINKSSYVEPKNSDHTLVRHGAIRKIWTPIFILGFAIIFLNRFAMSPIQGFLSLYVLEDLQWDAIGFIWALSAGSEMPFIFLSKRLIKRFGDLPLMAFATVAVFVRLLLCAFVPYKAGIIIAQCLHSFCYGIFHPAAVAFIARCVPPEHRALGMSLYLSLGTGVPTLIGNFAGGFIVEHIGYRPLFVIFSSFAVMGIALYFFTRRWTIKSRGEG